MRSLQVQVRRGAGPGVLALARAHGARTPVMVAAEDGADAGAGGRALVFAALPNHRVGAFVEAVTSEHDDASVLLLPIGALPLRTPLDRLNDEVRDVSRLSTLELVAGSIQSVGAWRGLLLYSVLAGVVGGYGLIFDVAYLLVAAMLINPMGAPALVSVIGLGVGDVGMVRRGGLRFLVSLAIQAVSALALGVAYGLDTSTAMMEQVTSLSALAVVVALAAGVAGALTQVKAERDSLVGGSAAGFMVAAALAPPSAVLGLSVPLGRWDYLGLMAFLLALQYVAITLGGWAVLHGFGVAPPDPALGRGRRRHRTFLVAGVAILTAGLVALQLVQGPRFTRADLSRDALGIARAAVATIEGAAFVEATARFTRTDLDRYDSETLLFDVVVEEVGGPDPDGSARLEAAVRDEIQRLVGERMRGVAPLVRVTVVPGRAAGG
jgi:uncharacterized membrane protein